jgi:hypothetical protein
MDNFLSRLKIYKHYPPLNQDCAKPPMQLESPSNANTQPLGTTRIRFEEPPPTKVSGKATTKPTRVTSPLEAALVAVQIHVATLHEKLQPFLKDLIGCLLKDASAFHYKSEKDKEMHADPEYVPTVCGSVGMRLQAIDEVLKSPGYKTLEDKLAKEIEALRHDWAMQFVLPVQDLNVLMMKKRYQLSFCQLLSMAAKGFITQAGAKGYNANTAVMDLLAMYGNDVTTPLNVNTHDLLVLFKEAAGLTIIPFPSTVLHNLTDVINRVNGDAQAGALGNNNKNLARTTAATMMTTTGTTMTTRTMTTATAAAATMMTMAATMATTTLTTTAAMAASAAANTLTKLITAAAAAVTRATSQKDLAHAIAEQARSIADKSLKCCTNAHTALEEAHCTPASTINPIKIAKAEEMIEVAEVTVSKLERATTAKGNIAYGANAFAERERATNTTRL